MDTGLISSILSLVAAAIPLIILLLGFLQSRTENTPESLDSPAIKVIRIKRNKIADETWERIKSRAENLYGITVIIYGLIVVYIASYSASYFKNVLIENFTNLMHKHITPTFIDYIPELISLIINITSFVITVIIVVMYFQRFVNIRHLDSEKVRDYIFKDVEIIIEADRYYLFNKCHEALRRLHLYVVEINEVEGTLVANNRTGWWKGEKQRSTVKITPVENTKRSYRVQLEIGKPFGLGIIPKSSTITNGFINHLISKSKDADSKSKEKQDTLS